MQTGDVVRLCLTLAVTVPCLSMAWRRWRLFRTGVTTEAIYREPVRVSDAEGESWISPYTFQTPDGRQYKGHTSSFLWFKSRVRPGDNVTVIYDPLDPSNHMPGKLRIAIGVLVPIYLLIGFGILASCFY
jgi:hypothetical protein